jgi:hypothetical protein
MKFVHCSCDACGKTGTCRPDDNAPRKWFYVVTDNGEPSEVIVCSDWSADQIFERRKYSNRGMPQ